MGAMVDPITVMVPRKLAQDFVGLSDDLNNRMHELLERNTDEALNASEKAELETLVRIAQLSQIVAAVLHSQAQP